MDRNDIIMSILEEKGLDKRFRENPEAVRQICKLIFDEIKNAAGKEISSRDEFVQTARQVLDRQEGYIGNDGKRYDTTVSIDEDGSLDVKLKTEVEKQDVETRRTDGEKIFSIGKEKGDLVVSEKSEYLSITNGAGTYASAELRFNVYNKHGLEMNARSIEQSVNLDTISRIANCRDAFNAIGRTGVTSELSPAKEIYLERGTDLATEYYDVMESNGRILFYEMDGMMQKNMNKDNLRSPLPLAYELGGRTIGNARVGKIPSPSPEYDANYLAGYTDSMADFYEKQPEEETKAQIQAIYNDSATRSMAFRKTLIEAAKTNPDLQKVVEQLDLVITTSKEEENLMRNFGIVKVSDLQRAYENVSAPEIKSVMQTLLETSRTEDRGKDTEDITKG